MADMMAGPLAGWRLLLAEFTPVFTHPSFILWCMLLDGWVLCPGRRTITRIIQATGAGEDHAHDAYHRLLRAGRWSMADLWKGVAVVLVRTFHPEGTIRLDLDDTLFHKTGRKVDGAGIYRDAVRSTRNKVVHALGLNLVVLTVRVMPPWCGVPLGLPVNVRLHRKDGPTYLGLAEEMITEFAAWFPARLIKLSADGAYAPLAGRPLPRTHFTSRMRSDAALYDLPPPRRKGQRGPRRKKGARLPTPKQIAAQTTSGWSLGTFDRRGKTIPRLFLSRVVLWYTPCKERPLLLIIVRDPSGKEPDDFFFTTDLAAAPGQVPADYAGRWSIEDTFRDVKQLLGAEDPQCWKGQGPERAAALSLLLYSLIWAWYIPAHGANVTWPRLPWYTSKQTPAFSDALAALRRLLWADRISSRSGEPSHLQKILGSIIEILAHAA